MQIKINDRYWWMLIIGSLTLSSVQAQHDKENKLIEFRSHGQWEVWCIDVKQSGRIECNLNHVLRYKNHPDFRAMIFRFYSDGVQTSKMIINKEWQSSFSRGYFQIGDVDLIDLSDCHKKCVLEGEPLRRIIDQFSSANKAMIRFDDYLIQEFKEDISLSGFAEGLQSLNEMQTRFN